MGDAPPENFPPPPDTEEGAVDAEVGFKPSPTGSQLCGFAFPPQFFFNFGFRLPSLNFDFPPKFFFGFGLNCDLDNPISAEAGLTFGGGRTPQQDPNPDEIDE